MTGAFLRPESLELVVADGSKVGRVALARMSGLDQIGMLITDTSADRAEPDRIRSAGVEVVVAEGAA